jgi:uncharacterized repeat protein (TIGR03803 family)
MSKSIERRSLFAAIALCSATASLSHAQTFTTLAYFDYTNGAFPAGALAQGLDGSLYGTTAGGGMTSGGLGTVFKITTGGALTTLYSFPKRVVLMAPLRSGV